MSWDRQSKWIWLLKEQNKDNYGEFASDFWYESGNVRVRISADSNYTLYVNGMFVASEQYPDYPHYKVYDEMDITRYCEKGNNRLAVVVWYYGENFMTYYIGRAAVRFEVECGGKLLAYSHETTKSRLSPAYENGLCHIITPQVGYGFCYDCTLEDEWKTRELYGFSESALVDQDLPLFARTVKKTVIGERAETELVKASSGYYLYDIRYEEVGYLTLKLTSCQKQKIRICYGEHIDDGAVRSILPAREFYVEVIVGEGLNEYTNYFRRLGCRYLELHAEKPVEIEYLSVLPCSYPLKKVEKNFRNPLHQKIYDVGVRTLELCVHEHYEDCPWREQGLYAMDSRNQMLCGYYAFEEFAMPRNNLYLMSKGDREDHLLSICIPTTFDYAIPSFTLHYFTEVYEYCIHSEDLSLAEEILPKLESMIRSFTDRIENGLIANFASAKWPGYWNFYEWSEGMDGTAMQNKEGVYDAALHCLVSLALQNLQKICDLLERKACYRETAEQINEQIRTRFYVPETGLYRNTLNAEGYSELVNALAVLCGAAKGENAERICAVLSTDNQLTKVSLSMACFKYDALLLVDEQRYAPYVIKTLETVYKRMLDAGATSFWEDVGGANDFNKAGSLCHGWSAMPVYYFNVLESYLER